MLKHFFGFAENQEKATYGLGHKLTGRGNKDKGDLDKALVLLMLELKLITYTGTYLITHHLFTNKVYYLNRF